MKRLVLALVTVLAALTSVTANESLLQLESAVVCCGVENRDPVDVKTSFNSDITYIWCHTKFINVPEDTTVRHIWYHGDTERASVDLKVGKSTYWRTWSKKTILKNWTGDWHVSIVDENDNVLHTVKFTVGN